MPEWKTEPDDFDFLEHGADFYDMNERDRNTVIRKIIEHIRALEAKK